MTEQEPLQKMDNHGRVYVRAMRQPWSGSIDLLIVDRTETGKRIVNELHTVPWNDRLLVDPTLRLNEDSAQGLLNDLWACGLRPEGYHGSEGELAATQGHLKDMQNLVYKLISKVLGGGT
jgi:hypothetical protein